MVNVLFYALNIYWPDCLSGFCKPQPLQPAQLPVQHPPLPSFLIWPRMIINAAIARIAIIIISAITASCSAHLATAQLTGIQILIV